MGEDRHGLAVQFSQGRQKLFLQRGEFGGGGDIGTANEHIIMTDLTKLWQNQTGYFPQPAFCTVACHRIADFFGTGEAHAHLLRIAPVTGLKDKTCGMNPFGMGQPQKVFAVF